MVSEVIYSFLPVIISNKQAKWRLRPPKPPQDCCIGKSYEDTLKYILSLLGIKDTKVGAYFTLSIHERRHFYDLLLGVHPWIKFLAWFHLASNIFQIINILKGKHVKLPLLCKDFSVCKNLPIDEHEYKKIKRAALGVGSGMPPYIYKFLEEVAYYLQFSLFPNAYYKHTFPINLPDDTSLYREFAIRHFCVWFCYNKEDYDIVKSYVNNNHYGKLKDIFYKLLKVYFWERKIKEINVYDDIYLKYHKKHYIPISSDMVNMNDILEIIVNYRRKVFSNIDLHVNLIDPLFFIEWMSKELRVIFIVDFGENLDKEQEITDSYYPSKWFKPRDRFLYYDDKIGTLLENFDTLEQLFVIQHLTTFLFYPSKLNLHAIQSPLIEPCFLEFTYTIHF